MVLLESEKIPLGTKAPDFSLKATDGKTYTLDDFSEARALVVIFMCNHCPYVQAVWDRFVALQEEFADHGVRLVGINPNLNPDYPEETFEKMGEYFEKYQMNFPYLQDDTQEVAKKYQAQCTPDIYLYDQKKELFYHGRLDDSWKDEDAVKDRELADAIKGLLAGEEPPAAQRPAMGCSIKWRE